MGRNGKPDGFVMTYPSHPEMKVMFKFAPLLPRSNNDLKLAACPSLPTQLLRKLTSEAEVSSPQSKGKKEGKKRKKNRFRHIAGTLNRIKGMRRKRGKKKKCPALIAPCRGFVKVVSRTTGRGYSWVQRCS